MIRPAMFNYNIETAVDNVYQQPVSSHDSQAILTSTQIQESALQEFETLVETIRSQGVNVKVLADTITPPTPDAVFPNNWFSTHQGTLILYPMKAENRQQEITKFRDNLIDFYQPEKLIDLTAYHSQGIALEGTGAMIFDRLYHRIYACISQRCDKNLLQKVAQILSYELVTFQAYQFNSPVYHTNVMMSLESEIALIGDSLLKAEDCQKVLSKLSEKREIISLSDSQIANFAGNALELAGADGKFLLISQSAYNSLSSAQITQIEARLPIISVAVPTIEKFGGGSVRCMVAEIF